MNAWGHKILVLVTLCAILPAGLDATTVIPPTFDELVQRAEVIFEGRVTKIESKWVGEGANRRIKTDYTFLVAETLKGAVPATYTLEVLGGTIGDVTLSVDGAPDFHLGDRALLFVTQNGRQFVPLVGVMHGHYRLETDAKTHQEILANHDGHPLRSVKDVGQADGPAGTEVKGKTAEGTPAEGTPAVPMTPKAFKDEIRAKVKQQAR